LLRLGAEVHTVKPAAIANPKHFVNVARKLAESTPGAVFMNQFETLANFRVHASTTGCEVWAQTGGQLDAFVMSAGTGGTIAGVSQVLKAKSGGRVQVVLADPPGSSLLNWVRYGVCFNAQQSERKVRKNRYESVAEGIGLDRVTLNLAQAKIDHAVAVTDQDALHVAHYLLRHEGLFVGSSSAMNVTAAVRFAARLPRGSRVVTVLCDSGARHGTRFWNQAFVEREFHLTWPTAEAADAAVAAMAKRGGGAI
jgi:cysteine synthase A